MFLKPLKPVKKVNTSFWTFDLETESLKGVKFVCAAIYQPENKPDSIKIFKSMEEIFDYLSDYAENWSNHKRGKYKNIFIHNLTFDIRFFLEYVAKNDLDCQITHLAAGSKDLAVILEMDGFQFRFIDSYQLTLLGQARLEQVLLGTQIKEEIDFENATSEDYEKRVKSDVFGLYECMCIYFTMLHQLFGINANDSKLISLSRLALKAFRTLYLPQPIYNPFCKFEPTTRRYKVKDEEIMQLIYQSYFGGRTEVFKRGITNNVECWDINSLYPSVFKNAYPVGKVWTKTIHNYNELVQTLHKYEGFIGGLAYESYSHIPILPTKDEENRTIFAYGRKKGIYPFPEIRYGLEKNLLRIRYPCLAICFQQGDFFNDFGEDTYHKRLKFQKEGNPLEFAIKIIMNSLYGKFGQKRNQTNQKLLNEREFTDIMLQKRDIVEFLPRGAHLIGFEQQDGIGRIRYRRDSIKPFYLPHISSYVTSYARVELHKALVKNQDNLLYCDTDSIWVQGTANINKGSEIGQWKLEKTASQACFIALKCYAYQTDTLSIRIKGVSKQMIQNAGFSSVMDFSIRITKIQLKENPRYNTIKKSLIMSKSYLSWSQRTKTISGAYSKRLVNSKGNTLPINTEMITVE